MLFGCQRAMSSGEPWNTGQDGQYEHDMSHPERRRERKKGGGRGDAGLTRTIQQIGYRAGDLQARVPPLALENDLFGSAIQAG